MNHDPISLMPLTSERDPANPLDSEIRRRIWELEMGVRLALRVLHKTSISKKAVADHLRKLIGLRPGERVRA
jgi:hypothetical protein